MGDRRDAHTVSRCRRPSSVVQDFPEGPVTNAHSAATPGRAKGWQLITVTYDAMKQQAVIFVNGHRDTEVKVDHAVPVNLDAFTLGGWTSGGRRFIGRMADPRLYNRVLTPAEIEVLLSGKPSTEGLVAAWTLNDLNDSTGHGHNLEEKK